MADMPVPMPIVVGAPRSGTTLLRMVAGGIETAMHYAAPLRSACT